MIAYRTYSCMPTVSQGRCALEAVLAKKPKHFSLSFELRTGQDN